MGKQKIARLLEQLKDNHDQDIQNAAAIFTVAQGAVNQLGQLEEERVADSKELPAAPAQLTKIDLINRYGNYNACRKVAKQVGITFRKGKAYASSSDSASCAYRFFYFASPKNAVRDFHSP
ncbi:MAG: hypothetical protein AAFW84_27270, partial [Cyanobacteria bacterium J06635_15]